MRAKTNPDAQAGEERAGYLTFSLDGELFALRLDLVREVLDPPPVTTVPNAPDFAPGLIHVRGAIMPHVDLRRRFQMAPQADTALSRIVVSRVETGAESFLVGIKADAVHEVVELGGGAVEPLPEHGTPWPDAFFEGVARHEGRFVLLLDLPRVLQTSPHPIP